MAITIWAPVARSRSVSSALEALALGGRQERARSRSRRAVGAGGRTRASGEDGCEKQA